MQPQPFGVRQWARWTVLFVLVALVVPVCAEAQTAKSRRGDRDRTQWWEVGTISGDLQLSQGQVARLEKLYGETDEAIHQARVDVRTAYRKLFAEMTGSPSDAEPVLQARAALEAAQQHLHELQLDRLSRLHDLLSDEQWQSLPSTAPRALRLGMSLSIRARHQVRISETGELTPVGD